MCLTTAALAAFLNLLGTAIDTAPGRITVHAAAGPVYWVARDRGDSWCTMGPQLERMARL